MRIWSIFRKNVRESKRDLWVLLLSMAFAPLFVFLYWLITDGTGSTPYHVLVVNHDVGAPLSDSLTLSAGMEIVNGLQELAHEDGSPLLHVALIADRSEAEEQLRDRDASALVMVDVGYVSPQSVFLISAALILSAALLVFIALRLPDRTEGVRDLTWEDSQERIMGAQSTLHSVTVSAATASKLRLPNTRF
ncbi:MAG TPA: hypothetical protein VMV80_08015 [Anaerolineales bacterium]|nr:hypothetical protein [Anaerolineales bacterium]